MTGKSGVLSAHGLKDYHKSCVVAMENFKLLDKNKQDDILSRLDLSRKNEIEQNRAHLKPIIDTILICSRQNIALRGHRGELGCIDPNKEPAMNDGNFRALLRF